MRILNRAAARCYPSRWRARYAQEFEALLEEVEPGRAAFFNILIGALAMHLRRTGVMAAGCVALGTLIGGAAALRLPETFASTATLRLPSTDESFLQRAQRTHAAESLEVRRRASVTIDVPVDEKTRSTMLTVTFADRDPDKAREVTERLIGSILTANAIPSGSIRTARTGPNRPKVAGTGAAAGLMIGTVVMWFRRRKLA
jgi:uncharacterized protein involved in exopolysaccharide biosynthesis